MQKLHNQVLQSPSPHPFLHIFSTVRLLSPPYTKRPTEQDKKPLMSDSFHLNHDAQVTIRLALIKARVRESKGAKQQGDQT